MCLSGVSAKRFSQLFNSLRVCGAVLPRIEMLSPHEHEALATRIESDFRPGWDDETLKREVEVKLRAHCGEIVNPSIVVLLCQEVSS